MNSGIPNENERTLVRYCTPINAALLYRLSGGHNLIHNQAVADDLNIDSLASGCNTIPSRRRPVPHGLCTVGYALQGVLHHDDGLHQHNGKQHPQ